MLQNNGQKKYVQIAEHIRTNIETGVYAEGSRIPPIRELARELQVNPQTVNKATAYLTSLGYLKSRQGSGSEVTRPGVPPRSGICMLVDESRSSYLENLDDPRNYHAKDIYLAYLLRMTRDGRQPRFLVYGNSDTELSEDIVAATRDTGGFIVQGTLPVVYAAFLAEKNVPTVFVNRRVPESISSGRMASVEIGLDRLSGMLDYFVTLGHRKILYLRSTEFERAGVFLERLHAVRQAAMRWRGKYEVTVEEFSFSPDDSESRTRFEKQIKLGYTAGIGYNDGSALAVYSLVEQLGLSVGSQFSVGGFDDIHASRLAIPPLTTVRVDRGRLVGEAFRLLQELSGLPGPGRLSYTLETELVIRRSALPPGGA